MSKITVTPGMSHAMSKLPGSGYKCPNCKMEIPKYTGRYPKFCSQCGTELNFNNKTQEVRTMSKAKELIEKLEGMVDEQEPTLKKIKVTIIKDAAWAKNMGVDVGNIYTIGPDPGTIELMKPNGEKEAISQVSAKQHFDFEEIESHPKAKK